MYVYLLKCMQIKMMMMSDTGRYVNNDLSLSLYPTKTKGT